MNRSVLFFGSPCSFADAVLSAIIAAGHDVRARLIPGHPQAVQPIQPVVQHDRRVPQMSLPIAHGDSREQPVHDVPILRINDHRSPNTVDVLTRFQADVAIVCCYPSRIPDVLMSTTEFGGLNIHPSLLPTYRGPEPLFWIYRHGERTTGLTIHRVISQLDAGPIVRQETLEIEVGKPGDELWAESAIIGGRLSNNVLGDLETALDDSWPQNEHCATYQSWPTSENLMIDPAEWNAWRVAHFCQGVIPLGYVPRIVTARGTLPVHGVTDLEGHPEGDSPRSSEGGEIIECRDGRVRIAYRG